jgi:mono/diheme cytochrome c family protein
MRKSVRIVVGMVSVGVLAAIGCGKNSSGSAAKTDTPAAASGPADGSTLFGIHCAKCHSTEADKPRGKGPNLAGFGSKADKPADWIAVHIKTPKAHKPESGMPGFDGKIPEADIKAIAQYVTTLK